MGDLTHKEGDKCPTDECEQTLHRHDHGGPEENAAAAPTVEIFCPIHRVVDSCR